MNRKVEDKIAVITGGSAGIGLGTARRFSAEGARAFIIEAPLVSATLAKAAGEISSRTPAA
jgi:NAD(P)-dependent dehydrogenase (short-subunit alcohol dehydrogenase family)